MARFILVALLLLLLGFVAGQDTASAEVPQSRLQWDAAHGVELSWRDSAGHSKDLAGPDRIALIHAIKAKLRPRMADMNISTEKELTRVAADTRIKLVDLDGDGTAEVIAQSMGMETCGGTGNCIFWVFKKTPNGYSCVLDSVSQSFVVEGLRSSGFSDVTLAVHDSASEKHLYVYRFSAGKYREAGCFDADWIPNIVGPALKRPVITKCKR